MYLWYLELGRLYFQNVNFRLLTIDSSLQTPSSRLLTIDSFLQTPYYRLPAYYRLLPLDSLLKTPPSRLLTIAHTVDSSLQTLHSRFLPLDSLLQTLYYKLPYYRLLPLDSLLQTPYYRLLTMGGGPFGRKPLFLKPHCRCFCTTLQHFCYNTLSDGTLLQYLTTLFMYF